MTHCLEESCEGWPLDPDWNYCPGCGSRVRSSRLRVEVFLEGQWRPSAVLGSEPARLVLAGEVPEGELPELPPWLGSQPTSEPGVVALQSQQAAAGSWGWIRWGGQSWMVVAATTFSARLRAEPVPAIPGSGRARVWLELDQGAAWLESLPPGWSCHRPLPRLLSADHWQFRSLELQVELQGASRIAGNLGLLGGGKSHWLAETTVELAGELCYPDALDWNVLDSPTLPISLRAQGGPVRIEGVAGLPAWIEAVGPLDLEAERSDSLVLHVGSLENVPPRADLALELQSADGRSFEMRVEVRNPALQPYPGWLLLDMGSHTTHAALLSESGRRQSLGEFPSQLVYSESGCDWPGEGQPEVGSGDQVELAKRYLGSPGYEFYLAHVRRKLSPDQIMGDSLRLLMDRLLQLEPLRHRSLERLCLTYPAAFAPRQVEALRRLAEQLRGHSRMSRLQIELISEPLAASYYFLSQKRSLPATVWHLLHYDLGGSSSDVAVVQVDSRQSSQVGVEIQSIGGDRWFGGQDITRMLAELLPPEQRPRAEAIKCGQEVDAWRSQLDPTVETLLERSLAQVHIEPQVIVLAGRASLYPLVAEWLQRRWPRARLERSSEPKRCVALGASFHPEVVRHLGPRLLEPDSPNLAVGQRSLKRYSTTRFGLRVMQGEQARFRSFLDFGQELPLEGLRHEIHSLAFLPGTNRLEILENLSWDDRLEAPDGQANPHVGVVRALEFELDEVPDPGQTRLILRVTPDYRLSLRVEQAGRCLADLGEVALASG